MALHVSRYGAYKSFYDQIVNKKETNVILLRRNVNLVTLTRAHFG